MAGESREGTSIPVSGIIGVVLLAATIFAQQARLDSARLPPQEPRRAAEHPWVQKAHARLWQDPMAAVARYREERRLELAQAEQLARLLGIAPPQHEPGILPPDDVNQVGQLLNTPKEAALCQSADEVRLIGAMVLGGPTEEDAEMRRRTRYAVVSGFISSGYIPNNEDKIGYAYVPESLRADADRRMPTTIPFEWFWREARADDGQSRTEWILLLWLDQSFYYGRPLSRLRHLAETVLPACRPRAMQVLGPVDSLALEAFRDDIRRELPAADGAPTATPPSIPTQPVPLGFVATSAGSESSAALPPFRPVAQDPPPTPVAPPSPVTLPAAPTSASIPVDVISASATAHWADATSQYMYSSAATRLRRVVGSDLRLSEALVNEIRLRRPGHKSPVVAVISEHDTDYARQFIEYIDSIASTDRGTGGRLKVRPYSFLRQIDGGRPTGASKRADANESDGSNRDTQRGTTAENRAHGVHHIDYLQRLVQAMKAEEAASGEEVSAVAIFGNDAYDKLLVLRALKSAFPKALFLTTDFDARLLDAQEAPWTANLIVATNYSDALGPELQRGVAPFRDGYQTATYLAAMIAADDQSATTLPFWHGTAAWLEKPLLFEIGRTGAVPLEHHGEAGPAARDPGCTAKHPCLGFSVHPRLARPEPPVWLRATPLFAVLVLLAVPALFRWADSAPASPIPPIPLIAVSLNGLKAVMAGAASAIAAWLVSSLVGRALPQFGFWIGLAYGTALCVGLLMLRHAYERNEPIRTLSTLLMGPAVYLMLDAGARIAFRNEEPFAWVDGVSVWPTQLIRLATVLLIIGSIWHMRSADRYSTRSISRQFRLAIPPARAATEGICRFWKSYVEHSERRIVSTIVFALLYLLAGSMLVSFLGRLPGTPVRGAANLLSVLSLVGLAVYLSTTLTIAVAVAYRGFIQEIIRPSRDGPLAFPGAALHERKLHLPALGVHEHGRSVTDLAFFVELVAERSRILTRFVYFPFVACALLVIARSPLFDAWDTPPGLAVMLFLPFVILIACVVWLRYETIQLREQVLKEMQSELLRLRGRDDITDRNLGQLERLYDQVKNENRGSFQNLALQPLIRALLLPIGGFSGIELLEHVVLR